MRRLTPYLIFVLLTAGLVAFIYKDQILPQADTGKTRDSAASGQGGGSRRGGGGGGGNYRKGDQIIPVVAQKVQTADVPVYLNGVGTVSAFNTATVRTQVTGRLIDVPYTEGQDVKEGDILALVDPALYKAALDQARGQLEKDKAILANARLDEIRYTNLVRTNAASQQQADAAVWAVKQDVAQVALDEALVANAEANYNWATIKAPFAGRTGIRLVDKGNLVSSADATGIVVITQLRPIAVIFTLPENTVGDVLDAHTRGPVELQAVTGGKAIGDGTLLVIDNQIDQTTGTYKIKGMFPNEQNRLWPGQFVNVRLKLKILQKVLVAPSVAIQEGPGGSYVYLATPENTVKVAPVTIVQEGERQAVIGSGVAADDLIVTSGFASLQDGSKVKVEISNGTGAVAEAPQAATPAPAAASSGGEPRRHRSQDAASGEAAASAGEHRHRRKQSQAGGEQAGVADVAPPAQGSPKP
ncbi:MAG: efflux RND transporter periplasmic adaptor subunit [Rhodomicrobium sp.]